jgi:ribonuclease HII
MQKATMIAGVDEAGRGPLAGPVYAAAVILNPHHPIAGLNDSKVLSEKKRDALYILIQEHALSWAIGRADVTEIDEINILQASMLAMQRAVEALSVIPTLALIDGNCSPILKCESRAIINGDALEPAISAASILAKVARDQEMLQWDQAFPQYGFAKHKGYGTRDHMAALINHGPCKIHRLSFAPVAKAANAKGRIAFS